MFKSSVPLSIQFEVTYRCNNNCTFCYNGKDNRASDVVNTEQAKIILKKLSDSGVLSVNFNGGEPLTRNDFFELAAFAKSLGLNIHLNSNLTLVQDKFIAKEISEYFPAVCTSVLADEAYLHDELSGRSGAFNEVIRAITLLQEAGVYVAVNIMLCKKNSTRLLQILKLLRNLKIGTVLITRYVTCEPEKIDLHIEDESFFRQLKILEKFQLENQCFARIALPQPLKICNLPFDLKNFVRRSNIACNIGLCTATVNCRGELMPCNLVQEPCLGNLLSQPLSVLWENFDGCNFFLREHLPEFCRTCDDLSQCGGGCMGYNKGLQFKNF